MTSTTKVILGIVGAAAAGVVIGLLIAPEKGSELRSRIGRTAGDWAGHLGDIFKNGKEEVEELKDRAMSAARTARNAGSSVKENLG